MRHLSNAGAHAEDLHAKLLELKFAELALFCLILSHFAQLLRLTLGVLKQVLHIVVVCNVERCTCDASAYAHMATVISLLTN